LYSVQKFNLCWTKHELNLICITLDVKGTQIHNQRESENSKNKDINKDRTILNYDLHNENHINYNHKVKEIIKDGYSVNK